MAELSEKEKIELDALMAVYGHKKCGSEFFSTKDYDLLRTEMLRGLPKRKDHRFKFKLCTKAEIVAAGKYVIEKHTHGVDTRVPYVEFGDLVSKLRIQFGDDIEDDIVDEMVEYINREISMVEVTAIPLVLKSGPNNAFTHSNIYRNALSISPEFFKKVRASIDEISIIGSIDETSKTAYVHEMYHALAYKEKGSIENILHNEVLPIFMEKVTTLDLNNNQLEQATDLERLLCTKNDILNREISEYRSENAEGVRSDETYILSTAVATALFDTYKNGNNKVKREINDSVNGVISGDHTLEDVLNKYEATPEKGVKILRKQIRKYSK